MAKSPSVSVILPTYNRAELLVRAIQSVLAQTYEDFELIVIDDASTDNTEEVVKSLSDPRLRFIQHDVNRGGAAARNTGIKVAQASLIAFQDSDDEWMPQKLEKQVTVLKNARPEVGVVYTDLWRIQGEERTHWRFPSITPEDGIVYDRALERVFCKISIVTALIRKECIDEVDLFDERFPRLQDAELFVKLSKHSRFCHLPEPLVNYFATENSISSNVQALTTAFELILERHSDDLLKGRKSKGRYLFSRGTTLVKSGHPSEGRGYIVRAIKSNPLNVGYMAALLILVFGGNVFTRFAKLKGVILRDASQ